MGNFTACRSWVRAAAPIAELRSLSAAAALHQELYSPAALPCAPGGPKHLSAPLLPALGPPRTSCTPWVGGRDVSPSSVRHLAASQPGWQCHLPLLLLLWERLKDTVTLPDTVGDLQAAPGWGHWTPLHCLASLRGSACPVPPQVCHLISSRSVPSLLLCPQGCGTSWPPGFWGSFSYLGR